MINKIHLLSQQKFRLVFVIVLNLLFIVYSTVSGGNSIGSGKIDIERKDINYKLKKIEKEIRNIDENIDKQNNLSKTLVEVSRLLNQAHQNLSKQAESYGKLFIKCRNVKSFVIEYQYEKDSVIQDARDHYAECRKTLTSWIERVNNTIHRLKESSARVYKISKQSFVSKALLEVNKEAQKVLIDEKNTLKQLENDIKLLEDLQLLVK